MSYCECYVIIITSLGYIIMQDVCHTDLQKDLGPYLTYCQDLVLSGVKLESEEEYMCEQLWKLYAQLPKKVSL